MAEQPVTGHVEVSRTDDDQIMLSFMNRDGSFHWYRFNEQAARLLAQKIEAVAIRAVDLA